MTMLDMEKYFDLRIADLRKRAKERPSNESFTPYNIAILELERAKEAFLEWFEDTDPRREE